MNNETADNRSGSTHSGSIAIPVDTPENVSRAVSELSRVLERAAGTPFPVETRELAHNAVDIHFVGTPVPPDITDAEKLARLGNQGFAIKSYDGGIRLSGGGDPGTAHAVYTFMESHLGCRWLTSQARRYPPSSLKLDAIGAIDEADSPAFDYREVFYRDSWRRSFSEPNKLNGQGIEGEQLKELHTGWGTWCHTFALHIPPSQYFDTNPEYFALVDGKRIPNGQLCLTNQKVFDLVIDDLSKRMEEQPGATYWSVSQNDCIRNCSCEGCREIDEREGTPMGSLLEFINRVAERFPDKIISTLAYQYTRKPPLNIKPADNVHITLCNIECNRSRPIADDPESASFRDDMVSWAKICENIFIWDYVIQFSHLVSPFPNLHVLGPNIRFFAENNARGIFSQGNREIGGELAELRAFLLAKLSWDLDYDVDRGITDFLDGYYGAAAEPIGRYITTMHDALRESNAALRIFGSPDDARSSYLTDDLIDSYNRNFDEAEDAVKGDDELASRVAVARLPLLYAQLRLEHGDAAARRHMTDRFEAITLQSGLEKVEEWRYTASEFVNDTRKKLG